MQRKFDAGAENTVEEDAGFLDKLFQADQVRISAEGDHLAASSFDPLDQMVVLGSGAGQVRADRPADIRQRSERHESVAAIVARTDQAQHQLFFALVKKHIDDPGQSASGAFHHLFITHPALIRLALDRAHLRYTYQPHPDSSFVDPTRIITCKRSACPLFNRTGTRRGV